ncbi:hypothetical protein PQ478_08695 [Alkalihalophilus pseudofirmus]|uniref:hypothetical protein n=1 Tax=Alkalihalophilus pseudofirmus TaxID=79885 RepID=UPI00259B35CC|nr:hypothetical protein [Alkalihalophilus pseudofirmus]WEG18547.1 hypothetical protein PQ478_08695 [Alkalihalophilus pseudofirmus]
MNYTIEECKEMIDLTEKAIEKEKLNLINAQSEEEKQQILFKIKIGEIDIKYYKAKIIQLSN